MHHEAIAVGFSGGPARPPGLASLSMRDEAVAPERSVSSGEHPPARRGELDLLRALVVVGLVFFHTAVIFGAGEFPVKAEVENPAAMVFIAFGATWGMPLLFVVSGMGIWYSLRSRSAGAFARERLRRLGVPLLVGVLTLVPLQGYLGMRGAGDRKSTRLNSSHGSISYAVFCLKQ